MSRVESASGAKYSTHNEKARKFEPIAPVGTNYVPVGKVDIKELRKAPPPAAKPVFGATSKSVGSAASLYGRSGGAGGSAPQDAWPEEKPAAAPVSQPPPPPAASRPAFSAVSRRFHDECVLLHPSYDVSQLQTTSRPAFSAVGLFVWGILILYLIIS